ncbi:MAG TPA: NAD-dependent epimerase/dehydratase family protein [Candidatus Saccharimonadales bacterium]|nr:NAD-dependent epimerase/dehydratase family protein [Candidatus Saccharimonadales bacterium]
MKTILVTGGAGHVGSHVIELLAKETDNHVICLDNYSAGSKNNHVAGVDYRTGSTLDIAKLVPETPDIVYHLGEYARIAPSFEDVRKVYELNIWGTFQVVEFCRERGVGKLVYAGSSTRYAAGGEGRNQNPYSFTKAVNVDLIINYGKWYDLPYAIAYFNNAFGPREGNITLIGCLERMYLEGKPLTIVKPGTQERNFTYVTDLARGLIMVGERGHGDGYVLGNQKSVSVLDVAKAFGGDIEMIDGYPGRENSGNTPTKARDELGWESTVDVLDYIKGFVATHERGSAAKK